MSLTAIRPTTTTPIITTLLDNDFYAFTMGQVIWRNWRRTVVRYAMTNRTTSVKLGRFIDPGELAAQIEAVRALRFGEAELAYLAGTGIFHPDYLAALAELELPAVQIGVAKDGQLQLHYEGPWHAAVYWETVLLALVNELYFRRVAADSGQTAEHIEMVGRDRLSRKITTLWDHPEVRLVEFGTRRRYSRAWQAKALRQMVAMAPEAVIGTSNVELARELGLTPSGTMAHQMFMVPTAIMAGTRSKHPIADAQAQVLDAWEAEYAGWNGGKLLTFLPDTYGTDTFLANLEPERLERWKTCRQDSGDPVEMGDRWTQYLRQQGRDPRQYGLLPSDGLTTPVMVELAGHFAGVANVAFGYGTDLTNDVGFTPVSLVIKPELVDGRHWCVKLSDNAAKAIGPKAEVARYYRMTGIAPVYAQACRF